jgi:thiamine biosynthesis lipoprotein
VDSIFINLLKMSKSIYNATEGAFNPAIYPLVTYWGFSPENYRNQKKINSASLDSAKALIRFDLIEIPTNKHDSQNRIVLKKPFPSFQLDFNAIAQGYTVDLIAQFFNNKKIANYMIEIGGEVRTKGNGPKNTPWRLGIDKPLENPDKRELQAIVNMNDLSLATSGNYRKFYVIDGKKYAHTIDPFTGKPVQHSLLSASVFTESCAIADAYATAFMVMGIKKSIAFVNKNPKVQVYLIYTASNGEFQTYISEGLKNRLDETF